MDLKAEMALPDDALANVLRRLAPRCLAASRSVCKAWRAIVDGRQLLLAHLLPHSLRGIFINYIDYRRPHLLARPSSKTNPAVDGNLEFLPYYSHGFDSILDHCNGLLLYGNGWMYCVVNPATRQWERLPRMDANDYVPYLVFDPAMSCHYEVLLIHREPEKPRKFDLIEFFSLLDDVSIVEGTVEDESQDEPVKSPPKQSIEDLHSSVEWPPSQWTIPVFSSITGQWQERSFVRQGEAIRSMTDVQLDTVQPTVLRGSRWRYGVYWRGALYVHCRGAFVTRLSLSHGKYQVINTPVDVEESKQARPYLGKSEKGVYFATIQDEYKLRVWNLNESSGQLYWVLKHNIQLDVSGLCAAMHFYHHKNNGPWILEGDNDDDDGDNNIALLEEDIEWNSDDDNVMSFNQGGFEDQYSCVSFLGFHPYKEVVFLELSFRGVAYHLNSSKVQYLGKLRPKDYYQAYTTGIYESFMYTPCMVGELSESPPYNVRKN